MELYKYVRNVDIWNVEISIKLLTYPVVRETRYCYVINFPCNKNGLKYILKENSNKKFARESKELALKDFIYKTKKCIRYQKANLKRSNDFLELANKLK
jgi:hypothetical protein